MKTELEQQLQQAEPEKIRAIDKVKDLKARIVEAEKEPSIFELMPIGSVWCGWEVVRHDKTSFNLPIGLKFVITGYSHWPMIQFLHKLIEEQKRLDAMKRAADAAVYSSLANPNALAWLRSEVEEYRKIIEKEEMNITFTEQEVELINKAISAARVDIYQTAGGSKINLTGVDPNFPNDPPIKQRNPMLISREGIDESFKVHEQLCEAQKMIMSKCKQ